jgi:tRNA A-37 threonylcarbamoyl transferase component Bud32
MHRNYIAHLDLESNNLALVSDVLHIIDFGLASRMGLSKDSILFAADLWATGRILKYTSEVMGSGESDSLMMIAANT